MESGQFYVTLPSNSSITFFPNNTLSDYKVKLPSHVNLDGTWEVGLASITFPHTWFTIGNEDRRFYFDDGSGAFNVALLPLGYYNSISEVIQALNKTITNEGVKGMSFQLNARSQKVTVVLATSQRLSFENSLGIILGFGSNIVLTKTTTAPHVCDLNIGLQSLFIYLNIVETQVVGDVLAPLLRIVPAQAKEGEIITLNYDNPQYVPVTTKDFEVMEVLITDDTGEKVSFEQGRVVLTLSFRRRSPYF